MDFNIDDIKSQDAKTAIVTGANTGLGFETTLGLGKTGMKVIMACRSTERGEGAKARVLEKLSGADLEVMPLDLNSLSSVRNFAKEYRKKYKKLDILINNAGIMAIPQLKTEDGFEKQLGVNHLGHFLLTSLLLDLFPNNSSSRIVSLSSTAHKMGKINFDDLQSEKKYSKFGAYGQSKLACILFANELQRRLEKSGKDILSVAAHPGGSNTELHRSMPKLLDTIMRYTILPFVQHPPSEAVKSILLAALSFDARGGEYYGPQGFAEMSGKPGIASQSNLAKDSELSKRLWKVSEELVSHRFEI